VRLLRRDDVLGLFRDGLRRLQRAAPLMTVYRCDWCGRFYSSPLPEDSACPDHIPEHNERHRRSIERFNERLRTRAVAKDSAASLPDSQSVDGGVETIKQHNDLASSLPQEEP
jgi:hypothetical protein